MMEMPTAMPTAKVTAASIAAPFAVVVLYVLNTYVLPAPLPELVALAVGALVTGLATLAAGYFKRPAERDRPRRVRPLSDAPPSL